MNNDQEKNDELAIADDGSMSTSEGVNIEVKTEAPAAEPEVNDIQAPAEPEVIEVTEPEPAPDSVDSVMAEESESPVEAPINTMETEPFNPESNSTINPITAAAVTGTSINEQSKLKSEHRNNKKLAVMLTVLVAVILAASTVYVYISAQDNTNKTTDQNTTYKAAEETVTPATSQDVDQAISEIDQTLDEVDSETNTDMSEDTVSDENLGLQ